MTHDADCGANAAAYVLGALDSDELDTFRRHLSTCSVCREEVTSMQQLVDALPETAQPQQVPRRLRRQILSEVRADAERRAVPHSRGFTVAGWQRPGLALVAAGALAVAVVVGTQIGGSSAHAQHTYAAEVGDASVRVTNGHGELIVRHLPRPSGTDVYEVWLQKPGSTPQPTSSLFNVTSADRDNVDVPGHLSRGDKVLVTEEPAGGTQQPTTIPVVVAQVS